MPNLVCQRVQKTWLLWMFLKFSKYFGTLLKKRGLQHPCGFPAGHKDFSVHGTIILIFATAYQEPKSVFATNI